jgi:hypothetical protein
VDVFHRNACRVGNYRALRHGRFRMGRVVLREFLPLKFPIGVGRRRKVGGRRLGVLGGRGVDGVQKKGVGRLVVRRLVGCLLRGREVVLDRRMREVVRWVVDTFFVFELELGVK